MLELQNVKKTFFAGTANEKKALRIISNPLHNVPISSLFS